MKTQASVEFRGVSKTFARHKGSLLRNHIWRWAGVRSSRFQALNDVSFRLEPGDGLAVIGPNGAGKSTLLSLAAGIAHADSGEVLSRGRLAALLDLGAGFHPDLTGYENMLLNSALLGFTRSQARDRTPQIIDFAELGEFINEPLRTYSAGMVMRLAFSVAVHVNPEILIADEILGVGDRAFQAKCYEKIRSLRETGTSMLCATHAASMLRSLCNKAIWLDHGSLILSGSLDDVLAAYEGNLVANIEPAKRA